MNNNNNNNLDMTNECPICLENLNGLLIELKCKHKYTKFYF